MAKITLYTAPDCHLCDLAKDVLYPVVTEYQLELELVDITKDEVLKAQYGLTIPVVKLANGVETGWPFTVGQVKRMLGK